MVCYVVFYVWNENLNYGSGGLERKRIYDVNAYYPTPELRRFQGEILVDNINKMLKSGYCIKRNLPEDQFKSKIDTTTSTGKLIFHFFIALAEFERNLI